ncbi:MAG: MFS transporter [Pseudomonadota bacterium]
MRWRILGIIGALYTAQFIPLMFAFMAVPIILRMEGHSATTIGLVQLGLLPYLFKFLWAPLIDKYKLGRDRYKSWIWILSALHLVSLGALAAANPSGDVMVLFVAYVLATLSVSTQDVAVDALVISILRPEERSMGATLQNFGAFIGAIIGGFGFLYLYSQIGWTVAILLQGAIFMMPLVALKFIAEPERKADALPVTLKTAFGFFTQPGIGPWLGFVATIRLPLMMVMLPMRLMMVDQGMSTEEIAVWFGLFAMSAGAGSTVIFGPLLRHLSRSTALYLVALLNIPVLIAVTYIAASFPDAIRYAIVLTWAVIPIADIVICTGAMEKSRDGVAGFDFSAQVAVYSFAGMFADPIIGLVIDGYGFMPAYFASIPAALIPLGILWMVLARPGKSPLTSKATG